MGKIRRVDFYPDEFLSGVDKLSPEEVGIYWLLCSKIYSRGEGLPDDDKEHARIFRLDPRTWKRLKSALLSKGKIRIENNAIINDRCTAELSKAGKRIDDARAAGQEGGRPRGAQEAPSASSSAEDSPTVGPTIGEPLPQPSANRSPILGDKPPHELNGNNGVGKAPGFSGEKLTNNQQPPTTKEEVLPPKEDEGTHAFTGKIIRLTEADLTKWRNTYHAIADLEAELSNYDAWFDDTVKDPKERRRWFHRTRQRMNAIHQKRLAERPKGGGPDLREAF